MDKTFIFHQTQDTILVLVLALVTHFVSTTFDFSSSVNMQIPFFITCKNAQMKSSETKTSPDGRTLCLVLKWKCMWNPNSLFASFSNFLELLFDIWIWYIKFCAKFLVFWRGLNSVVFQKFLIRRVWLVGYVTTVTFKFFNQQLTCTSQHLYRLHKCFYYLCSSTTQKAMEMLFLSYNTP